MQEEALNNDEGYEYFIDENSAQRRMMRLLRRISRVGDISNGIYHPTLVPSEDKRIAGVSKYFIHLFIECKSYLIVLGRVMACNKYTRCDQKITVIFFKIF